MGQDYICTWIYLDSPEEKSEYPQVGKSSHLPGFQKVYWKCVAVFFAFSVRFNPGKRHILFTNQAEEKLPDIDGFSLRSFFREKQVEVVTMPMTWQTPNGFYHKWRNQFFVFDIFNWFEKNCDHATPAFILLDSDCIIKNNLDRLFEDIRRNGLMVLPMPFDDTYDINGITRKDMRQIYSEMDGKDPGFDPVYYGGEFFGATMDNVKAVNRMMPEVWEQLMQRFKAGKKKFHYEGPTLSYMYYKIGKFGLAGDYIKRIWTSPKFSNVQEKDINLSILHLPAEKTGGIALLFKKVTTKNGIDRLNEKELGEYLGVPKRRKWNGIRHWLKYTYLYRRFNVF